MRLVTEALVEAPVGAAIIKFLDDNRALLELGAATVSARVEDGPHIRVVESGGSGDRDLVLFGQQITLETFGATLTLTSALMRGAMAGVRMLQHTVVDGVIFYGLRSMGGGLNAADSVTKRARYSRTFVIDSRLTPLS